MRRTAHLWTSSFVCLVVAACTSLQGCGQEPVDVTNDSAFGGFSAITGEWRTTAPLKLMQPAEGSPFVDSFDEGHKVIWEIPPGTSVTVQRLQYRETIQTNYLEVVGTFATGPMAGKPIRLSANLFDYDVIDFHRRHHGSGGTTRPWTVNGTLLVRASLTPSATETRR